jgi:hypothetical protein
LQSHINAFSTIKTIIEPQMVGGNGGAQSNEFFIHTDPSSQSSALEAQLTEAATQLGITLQSSSVTDTPPPSSVEAFLLAAEDQNQIATAVISDFDSQFTEKFYESHLDTVIDDPNRICQVAEVMARTALKIASNITMPDETPIVNCTLVSVLVHCFTVDLGCDYLVDFGFPDDYNDTTWTDDKRRATTYTSVFRMYSISTTPIITFAQLFFAKATSQLTKNPECEDDSDCEDGSECVIDRCYNGTSLFHQAFPLGLEYDYSSDRFKVKSGESVDTTWTESNWDSLNVKLHQQEDFLTELGFFGLGVGLMLLTALGSYFIPKHYKRILYGMQ